MSIKIMSQVWEAAPFDGYTLLTLLALADHAGDDGWAWPSVEFLKKKTRLPDRTVYQAIKNLVEKGWLEKTTRDGSKKIFYRVVLPAHHAGEKEKSPAHHAEPPARYAKPPAHHAEPPHPHKGRTVIEPSGTFAKDKPSQHTQFKDAFNGYFQEMNTGSPAPWDGKEAANLSRWMAKNPTVTLEQWEGILANRAKSPVNHALELSVWIGKALTWKTTAATEQGANNAGRVAANKIVQTAENVRAVLARHRDAVAGAGGNVRLPASNPNARVPRGVLEASRARVPAGSP